MMRTAIARLSGLPRIALALCVVLLFAAAPARGATVSPAAAPGAPGATPYWAIGRKEGIGSALGAASNVWYTLASGGLTEVFYPTTDTPDVTALNFVVSDGRSFTDLLGTDTPCEPTHLDPRSEQYFILCASRAHGYRLLTTYLSDPDRPTVLVHAQLTAPAVAGRKPALYVRYDPSLNGNGTNDGGHVAAGALLAHDNQGHYGPVASALSASPALDLGTTGYEGSASDPLTILRSRHSLAVRYAGAGPGNIVQGARIHLRADGSFDLALGFGPNEALALGTARQPVPAVRRDQHGLHRGLASLRGKSRAARSLILLRAERPVLRRRAGAQGLGGQTLSRRHRRLIEHALGPVGAGNPGQRPGLPPRVDT
jgi:glucoamylase